MGAHVAKNVLGLDVPMANTLGVNVGDGPHELIRIQFDDKIWHLLLHLVELLHHSVGSVRNVIHDDVQIHLIWLLSIGVEALPHFDAVRVMQHLEDGELPILVPFVLEHFFDGYSLSGFGDSRFEYDSERSITNNFFSVVSHALKNEVLKINSKIIYLLVAFCRLLNRSLRDRLPIW